MNKTIIVQIGNSDDKLSQREWAEFIHSVQLEIKYRQYETYFAGGSSIENPWQNYTWVLNFTSKQMKSSELDEFSAVLTSIRQQYRQDSLALTVGETKFL